MRMKRNYLTGAPMTVEAFGGMDGITEAGKLAAELHAESCPFCGGEAVADLTQLYGVPSVCVECSCCHIGTHWVGRTWDYFEERELTFADAMTAAVQKWNRRTHEHPA